MTDKRTSLGQCLTKGILDASFREFRNMLEYKVNKVLYVDRYFPSSKLCSKCNNKKLDLKLSDRIYKCDKCGLVMDRDLNSAKLIKLNTVG